MTKSRSGSGVRGSTEGYGEPADLMVIFGITGDLAHKMTFHALYRLERRGLLDCPIIGVAADELSTADLAERAKAAIGEAGEQLDQTVFDRLAARLSYLHGDVTDPSLYKDLAARMGDHRRPLFYLEMPPSLFGPIVEQLATADLLEGARVAIEKPFGHDLTSARELDARLHQVLSEDQILRVDHFLGKEPVIELEYLRFANLALAEIWDRKSVSCIQITMAENFGVEDRGSFYDAVGALRDVVQNHLLQVLALVAMEPPAGASSAELRDKKAEVFKAMPALDPQHAELRDKKAEVFKAMPALNPQHCVRGQYDGYSDVRGVAAGSSTETFVALRLEIDNWRWAGVPIFLRAGKAMAESVTEVRLFLRRTPPLTFLPTPTQVEPNQIVLRIDPQPGLQLRLATRGDGSWRPVLLENLFAEELGEPREPYERLLRAALVGDSGLFAREDGVEETWRIVQPLLDHPPMVRSYEQGSWGPATADELLRGHPRWQHPWVAGGTS